MSKHSFLSFPLLTTLGGRNLLDSSFTLSGDQWDDRNQRKSTRVQQPPGGQSKGLTISNLLFLINSSGVFQAYGEKYSIACLQSSVLFVLIIQITCFFLIQLIIFRLNNWSTSSSITYFSFVGFHRELHFRVLFLLLIFSQILFLCFN